MEGFSSLTVDELAFFDDPARLLQQRCRFDEIFAMPTLTTVGRWPIRFGEDARRNEMAARLQVLQFAFIGQSAGSEF